jgi:hypothetical protein
MNLKNLRPTKDNLYRDPEQKTLEITYLINDEKVEPDVKKVNG